MGKYQPLGRFLREQRAREVPLTFDEIEKITGVSLPPRAQLHRAWWSNNASNNVMTKVWLDAGYRTEQVDVAHERLVFRRVGETDMQEGSRAYQHKGASGGHPAWGALKGTFTIEIGFDPTKPAMPEWADIVTEMNEKEDLG